MKNTLILKKFVDSIENNDPREKEELETLQKISPGKLSTFRVISTNFFKQKLWENEKNLDGNLYHIK